MADGAGHDCGVMVYEKFRVAEVPKVSFLDRAPVYFGACSWSLRTTLPNEW